MITAEEAAAKVSQQQRALNSSRYVPTLPRIFRKVSEENRVYIFNVGPWGHVRELGSAGSFLIPACPEGEKYSVPIVIEGVVGEPYPKDEASCVTLPSCGDAGQLTGEGEGMALAQQIVGQGPHVPPNADYTRFGVFISSTPVPSKAALTAAHEALQKQHLAHIREANNSFMSDPANKWGNIQPKWHTVSAHALKKTKAECPWLGESLAPAGRDNCPSCGDPYNVGIMKCRCGFILDKPRYDKAVKEGLFAA